MAQEDRVAIVGGGRLGAALARGLMTSYTENVDLSVAERNEPDREELAEVGKEKGFKVVPPITDFSHFTAVVLAVKPYDIRPVLQTIARTARPDTVIISGAVGFAGSELLKELGPTYPVIRAMFSIFAENSQTIIPVFPCNNAAETALSRVRWLYQLGTPQRVSEDFMEMSGWDLSTFAGVIVAKMLRHRLMQVLPTDRLLTDDRLLTEKLLVAGIRNLAHSLEIALEAALLSEESLAEALNTLSERIATPGGRNEAMVHFLNQHEFWQLLTDARAHFLAHRLPHDSPDPSIYGDGQQN